MGSTIDIVVNQDGSVSLGQEVAFSEEINSCVNSLFLNIFDDDFFEDFEEKFSKLKKPIRAIACWIFNHLVVAFLVSVVAGMYSNHVQNLQDKINEGGSASRREVVQHIKKLPAEINLDEFIEHRVVIGNGLRIREKPNTKSRMLGMLFRRKLVKVIQRRHKWTYIEVFLDESNNITTGWVYNKYLAKLRR